MSWETDANPEISRMIAGTSDHFGLGSILNQSRIGGEANKNYSVQTSTGDYIFKVILEHPLEDVELEVTYLQRLKEFNFPASSYVEGPLGSPIYQDQG